MIPNGAGYTTTRVALRVEQPEDVAAIHQLNALAFGQAHEAQLVDALRAAQGVVLSLVATEHGRVVGHLLFSPVIVRSEADSFEGVGLGPMAIHPDRQRTGIGSALLREGLARLRADGHRIVVVLGHPDYYPRFGFRRASELGLRWEHEAPDEAFMCLELEPGALAGRRGVVAYRAEFDGV
jgi:putative acetyltransferase